MTFHKRFFDHDRLILKFEELLLQLHDQTDKPQVLQIDNPQLFTLWETPFLQNLIENIESKPQLQWDFAQEAQKLNISITHFRRLFKQLCGVPPQQFLINQRLRSAANLLCSNSKQISEIAYLVELMMNFIFQNYSRKNMEYRHIIIAKKLHLLTLSNE